MALEDTVAEESFQTKFDRIIVWHNVGLDSSRAEGTPSTIEALHALTAGANEAQIGLLEFTILRVRVLIALCDEGKAHHSVVIAELESYSRALASCTLSYSAASLSVQIAMLMLWRLRNESPIEIKTLESVRNALKVAETLCTRTAAAGFELQGSPPDLLGDGIRLRDLALEPMHAEGQSRKEALSTFAEKLALLAGEARCDLALQTTPGVVSYARSPFPPSRARAWPEEASFLSLCALVIASSPLRLVLPYSSVSSTVSAGRASIHAVPVRQSPGQICDRNGVLCGDGRRT